MRTRAAWSVAVVLLLATSVFTQVGRGTIRGTIVDTSGSPLPGVTVTLAGAETRRTASDARGTYEFRNLPPGPYDVRAELAGFVTLTMKVTVNAGGTSKVDVRLHPATLDEQVAVGGVAARASKGVLGDVGGGAYHAAPGAPSMPSRMDRYAGPFNTEAYDSVDENPFRRVTADPLSTFSIDVDTASYANVRRFLTRGTLPPAGAVRIEELVNYFRFDYPKPSGDAPFSITTELTECPWNPRHRLALIGLQAREIDEREPAPRNLVFLIDVSGSMIDEDKLPLVRAGLQMLTTVLTERDRVAIVVYAGASGLVLPSTSGDRRAAIHEAIGQLEAGGSTNGAAGITLAYQVAREHFIRGGVNRVILATDGDFNVGVTSQDELVRLIERERESGIFLSVLGVGTGNLKDSTMEKLADKGNGNYSYLDSLHEARKVLVREAGATLVTVAKDVKIQVEFNPRRVAAYRLIGYENRILRHEDFNDDRKDAGEIGAGHSATALYEIVPVGEEVDAPATDPLKYQAQHEPAPASASNELVTVKLRYKQPDGDTSRLLQAAMADSPGPATANIGFASAVAEFGMLLRGSKHAGASSFAAAAGRARRHRGPDPEGYRGEFIKLVELASSLRVLTTSREPRSE